MVNIKVFLSEVRVSRFEEYGLTASHPVPWLENLPVANQEFPARRILIFNGPHRQLPLSATRELSNL